MNSRQAYLQTKSEIDEHLNEKINEILGNIVNILGRVNEVSIPSHNKGPRR